MPNPIKKKSKYELALEKISKEKGFKPEDFKEYQRTVRYLESKGKYDAIQKPRKGYTNAPGRGAYQYELSTDGGSGSSSTALKRAKQWATENNFELPEDLNEDFSKMSPESQDLVDLINYRKSPSGNFDYIKNKDYKTAYLKHHWAGPKEEYDNKASYFDTSINEMKKKEYNLGGALSAGLDTIAPGVGTGLSAALSLGSALKGFMDQQNSKNQIQMSANTNPYGKMEKGGTINPALRDFLLGKKKLKKGGTTESPSMKTYTGPSHEEGGIAINPDGKVGPNGPEVEGNEKAYTFKDGSTYVFPTKMKKIIDKMSNKYSDMSITEQNTLDFKMKGLRDTNEKMKSEDNPQILSGGGPTHGDPVNPLIDYLKTQGDKLKRPNLTIPRLDTVKPQIAQVPSTTVNKEESPSDPFRTPKLVSQLSDGITGLLGMTKSKREYNPNLARVEELASQTSFDNQALDNKRIANNNSLDRRLTESNRGTGTRNANRLTAGLNNNQNAAEIEISKNQTKYARNQQLANTLLTTGAQRAAVNDLGNERDLQNIAATKKLADNILDTELNYNKYKNNSEVQSKMSKFAVEMLNQKYTNFGLDSETLGRFIDGTATEEDIKKMEAAKLKFKG